MSLIAVFGSPIAHSLSPLMHNFVYERENREAVYTRVLLERGEELRSRFDELGLIGANITVPHKEFAFSLADETRGVASEIGAANTWVREGGKIVAHNTDAPGFMRSIAHFGAPKNALILGAGGTARAIAIAFKNERFNFVVVNRGADRLKFFNDRRIKTATHAEIPNEKFDLVINATSAGLKDDSLPMDREKLAEILAKSALAVDAIYGKKTPFLRLAESGGAKTQDGEMMLAYQGAIAHSLFFKGADIDKTAEMMKTALRLPKTWR